MRKRMLELMGVVAAITFVSLMASVAGQIRGDAPTRRTGPAPKTAWGEPSLQGNWDVVPYQVPLQRPAKYAGREFFTAGNWFPFVDAHKTFSHALNFFYLSRSDESNFLELLLHLRRISF